VPGGRYSERLRAEHSESSPLPVPDAAPILISFFDHPSPDAEKKAPVICGQGLLQFLFTPALF